MVRSKTNNDKYVFAAVLTLIIFFAGLFLGLVIDSKRVEYLKKESNDQKLEFSSVRLQYEFIETLRQENNCQAVLKTFDKTISTLENTRERLEEYNKNSKINKEDYQSLRREYTQAQFDFLLLTKKAKAICNDTEMATILYFYSTQKECPDCAKQAFVLDYLKRSFKDKLLIFSFDSKMIEEPMISLLMRIYDIQDYPGLVVEGETFNKFTEKDVILPLICQQYTNQTKCEEISGINIMSNFNLS